MSETRKETTSTRRWGSQLATERQHSVRTLYQVRVRTLIRGVEYNVHPVVSQKKKRLTHQVELRRRLG